MRITRWRYESISGSKPLSLSSDRICGVVFLGFSAVLHFFILPSFVETGDGGAIQPGTLPDAVVILMAGCSAWLVVRPTAHKRPEGALVVRAGLYLSILGVGVWAMAWIGFLVAAPGLILAIMLSMGERRWLWLGIAGLVLPLLIWLTIEAALERPLP